MPTGKLKLRNCLESILLYICFNNIYFRKEVLRLDSKFSSPKCTASRLEASIPKLPEICLHLGADLLERSDSIFQCFYTCQKDDK